MAETLLLGARLPRGSRGGAVPYGEAPELWGPSGIGWAVSTAVPYLAFTLPVWFPQFQLDLRGV